MTEKAKSIYMAGLCVSRKGGESISAKRKESNEGKWEGRYKKRRFFIV